MHGVWNFFLERKQFTTLLTLALLLAGAVAVIAIPKESAPEVEVPVAVVSTVLRGASAADVVKLVTKEIEKEVSTVDNISNLTSSSREGISIVTAEFEASANLDKSIQDVKDAVDRAKPALPRDADDPVVQRINFSEQPILIVSLAGGLPPAEFTRLSKEVKDEIELVSGVSRVDISGNRDREVEVVVEREALVAFGLSLSDVIASINSANSSLPVGSITVDDIEYSVAFRGDLADPEELAGVTVGLRDGNPIYLRDVAEVINGIERAKSISRVSIAGTPAEPAVTLSIYKKSGGDITVITGEVEQKIEELSTTLLKGITPLTVFSTGEQVQKDLSELTQVGFETVILVMLCLFLTIGWRESVVAGLSIPLSFVIAFIGLYASGNTINFVSLFSLILAIGILVDSGIVVIEAIHTRYKKFGNPDMAAKEAIREYAWPLIAGTFTTVAVFAPLFFISGVTGEFIASIPFTIIFVLIASIFVALGIMPLIAIRFTKREMSKLEEMQEVWNSKIQTAYREWLARILQDKKFQRWFLRGIALAFVLVLTLPVFGAVKVIFFPQDDSELVYLEIEEKQGTPLEQTDLATRAIEEILYTDKRIESFVTTVGAASSFGGSGSSGPKYANMSITLVPRDDRDQTSTEIIEEYRSTFSVFRDFTVRAYEPSGGPPTGAPLVITFSGENLDDLERAVNSAEQVLGKIEGTAEVATSIKDDGAEFSLSIDRGRAAEVGLSPAAIAGILRTAVSGAVATTIKTDTEDIDVLVSLDLNPNWKDPSEITDTTIESLTNLTVRTPRGDILLGSLLTTSIEKSNALIRREDQKNIATVSSYLSEGKTAADISSAFSAEMEKISIPDGVAMNVGGETEDVDKSFQEMFFALIGGMVLMLAILVLAFNSFRYALYLLMLVPLSLIGVFVGLAITGKPLSFPSLLGVIALAGVIINHAIILMDSMIVRMKNPEGRNLAEVVVDASASRLRPIVLTTVTTVVGMIPLAGASALWGPLAYTIMFGLTFAMLLTLVLSPILIYRHPGKQYWKESTNGNPPEPKGDLNV